MMAIVCDELPKYCSDAACRAADACRKPSMLTANDVQHGGDHYKKRAIQPWDFVAANGIGFFEGNAIKYLSRWRDKGGVEDLKKARHYIDKLIEIEGAK